MPFVKYRAKFLSAGDILGETFHFEANEVIISVVHEIKLRL